MAAKAKLTVEARGDHEVVIIREFAAPRQLVFDAHTKPELIRKWLLGPDGWEMSVCDVDLRVGGKYRYQWRHTARGESMSMGGTYREIVAPQRIVNTESFDDPWYPGEALCTLQLTERAGRTTLTQTMRLETRAGRDGVLASGMEGGLATSYDRLEAVLAEHDTQSLRGA
jgi:uncharacterized protein YndB with AHSA1/START domain